MSNINVIRNYIQRNPSLSDEDIAIRLSVPTKLVRKAREENKTNLPALKNTNEVANKLLPDQDKPDIVENPVSALKNKIRQIDQTFDIARKEFLIDPNSDNAHNMSIMLQDIKSTLKELDTFTDLSIISDSLLREVIIPLMQRIMDDSYEAVQKFAEDIKEYLPESLKFKADEFPKEFVSSLGKNVKDRYDHAIDDMQQIVDVDLSKYRTSERTEPLKKKRK